MHSFILTLVNVKEVSVALPRLAREDTVSMVMVSKETLLLLAANRYCTSEFFSTESLIFTLLFKNINPKNDQSLTWENNHQMNFDEGSF